jgi:hypothetical protein
MMVPAMSEKTIEFCGELQGETDKCWYVYDGVSTVAIPKRLVVSLRLLKNRVDCVMESPEWLARKKGILP